MPSTPFTAIFQTAQRRALCNRPAPELSRSGPSGDDISTFVEKVECRDFFPTNLKNDSERAEEFTGERGGAAKLKHPLQQRVRMSVTVARYSLRSYRSVETTENSGKLSATVSRRNLFGVMRRDTTRHDTIV